MIAHEASGSMTCKWTLASSYGMLSRHTVMLRTHSDMITFFHLCGCNLFSVRVAVNPMETVHMIA